MNASSALRAAREPLRAANAAPAAPQHGSGLTEVEMTWVGGRIEQWLRFGRVAATRTPGGGQTIAAFRPGATFALVRWSSNDFGTFHMAIAVITAVAPGSPCVTHPCVRPGGDILLRLEGSSRVQAVLDAIDAIEAAGIDACDAAPDHWRHLGSRIGAGLPFRPYGTERHAAWLRRRELGS